MQSAMTLWLQVTGSFQLHYKHMESLSSMQSIIDYSVILLHITVFHKEILK
jgi:hypothetical protein